MSKVYQPIVIEQAENLLKGLKESKFFEDYEITDLTYAEQHLLEIMNEKYILGLLGDESQEFFTEEEFTKILQEIVTGTILYELKEKGYINSYKDDNIEEMFFLTDKGKKHIDDLKNDID